MKGTITGLLVMVIERKETRSEGPEYYIKPTDNYKESWDIIHVRKKTQLWQEDPNLQKFVNKNVEILADILETRTSITIDYIEVKEVK